MEGQSQEIKSSIMNVKCYNRKRVCFEKEPVVRKKKKEKEKKRKM